MNKSIKINGISIGEKFPPYIVAEMSANHNGDINNALQIIKSAKENGANAVKIQTYRPDTMTIESDRDDFKINEGLWKGQTLYNLYEQAHTPWEWHKDLFDYAKKLDITIFSSPFDKTAVDFLEDLNTPAYKIASFEIVDIPLIKYVASTKKPIIISTGMANDSEIKDAVNACYESGCNNLALLHCVSGYPASSADYNLKTITDIKNQFNHVTGLSDHTLNNITAIASIPLGVSIIEKHFTLDRKGGGPDDSFSLEPEDLKNLCESTYIAWEALGKIDYNRKFSERDNVKFRRSLYVIKDLKKGEIITKEHIKSIRPGYGLSPKYFHEILGKIVNQNLKKGEPFQLKYIKD
ncbi:MAG: pseudaminic acid synthase [Pelagibacteraceae bacterium]|jgi:pseudaminic acid synthase|nr:pseudaminic acid synthase [Pelagibacteraceae bacterium]MBT6354949.1 pseudaminic acid synthase [Pelagibacteraceae bacterium]